MQIDVVLPWVDGNDEKHRSKMLPYVKDKSKFQSEMFRTRFDHVNEIKFAVDSILKFAPFVTNIYLITDKQTPDFLTKENNAEFYNKVSIIDHTLIFSGYEEYLPTFNNRPIDTCLHRIPNLAEHFLYFNDDVFLINKTQPEDFFKNEWPIIRGEWTKFEEDKIKKLVKKPKVGHKTAQQIAAKQLGFKKYYRFRHTPHPLRKSTFVNYFKENEDIFIENIKHKFRHPNQFTPQGLANHIEIKNGTCYFENDLKLKYFRSYKKPLFWYKFKLNVIGKGKLFLGLQSLDHCPPIILTYLLKWLDKKTNTKINY
ncbi:Stealth CR1 domain-containing protein [uncultured Algibacter sp.]|uniref:Stealth CR1 domain-containing protein n=1 Tax=uncultured Algibacter sp. TaxID=298659 RepID=UPI00260F6379|nr:Stealth CR1 domain-containing protein [uncultured Algibacter sp.]